MPDKKPLGLVVGETADLPQSFILKNGIEVVQFEVDFPEDSSHRDPRKNFYARMRQGEIPKTTQPPVGWYRKAFRAALDKFDQILVITISSALSGALQSADEAKKKMPEEEQQKIHILDSRLASAAEGLLCRQAQDFIHADRDPGWILACLDGRKGRSRIRSLGLLESVKWLEIGGRITHAEAVKAGIAKWVGVRAAITLKDGKLEGVGKKGIKFSPRGAVASLLGEIKKAQQQTGKGLKVAVAHADIPSKQLQKLTRGIENMGVKLLSVSELTPVLGAHSGPGATFIAWI